MGFIHPEAIERLYDAHAPELYALALAIAGSETAAEAALTDVFTALARGSATLGADFVSPRAALIRLVRDASLARREARFPISTVHEEKPTARSVLEDVFFRGATVTELATRDGLSETDVRKRLIDGISELRGQFAVPGTDG